MIAPLLALLPLIVHPAARADAQACPKCVLGDAAVERELLELSALPPKVQLARVRASGACVQVLDSGRKAPTRFFSWGSVEAPSQRLDSASRQRNLMGKTFCKGEQPIAEGCPTIVLASDAPQSTLWHEFLHLKQIEKDPGWCALSKSLWGRKPTTEEARVLRDKEWDVHRLLWLRRAKLHFGVEDEVSVASETLEEAELRKTFDGDAAGFVETERLPEHLTDAIARYRAALTAAAPVVNIDGIEATASGKKKQWKRLPVRLCVSEGVPEKLRPAITEAAAVWNRSFPKPVFDLGCTKPAAELSDDEIGKPGDLSIRWITSGFERFGDKTLVARTLTEASDDTGELLGATVLFNAGSFDWSATKIDLETVAMHELGHVLGLDHNTLWADSVMGVLPYQSGVRFRKLGEYERVAVGQTYFAGAARLPAYLVLDLNKDADGALAKLEAAKSRTSRDEYATALLERAARRFPQAVARLRKIVKKDPASTRARYELGDSYWSMGQEADAAREFRAVVEKNPDDYEALANLGSIALRHGRQAEARRYFEKTVAVNPVHYLACYVLFQISHEERFKECVLKFSTDQELIDAVRAAH